MREIYTTEVFDRWFRRLRDVPGKRRIQARIDRLTLGHAGDSKTLSGGIREMRIHCGPGYRVYYMERDSRVIILLAGGDKGNQRRDIDLAVELARALSARKGP